MEFDNQTVALMTALACFMLFFLVANGNKKPTVKRKKTASQTLRGGIKTIKKRQAAKKNPASTYKPNIIPKGYSVAENGDLIRKK